MKEQNHVRKEYHIDMLKCNQEDMNKKREALKSLFASLENDSIKVCTEYYDEDLKMSFITVIFNNENTYISTIGYYANANDTDLEIFTKVENDDHDAMTGIKKAISDKYTNDYDLVIIRYAYFIVNSEAYEKAANSFNTHVGENIFIVAEKQLQKMRENGADEIDLSILYILLGKMYETGSVDTASEIYNRLENEKNSLENSIKKSPKQEHKLIQFSNKNKNSDKEN